MTGSREREVTVAVLSDVDLVRRGVQDICAEHPVLRAVTVRSLASLYTTIDIALFDPFLCAPVDKTFVRAVVSHPAIRVPVAFTWQLESAKVTQALAMGFSQCLWKASPAVELQRRLVEIGRADRPAAAAPDAFQAAALRTDLLADEFPDLSVRELEMLSLIAAGLTNQQIATRTFLSINSIKTYIRSAYRKIGVNRRSMAILWTLEHLPESPAPAQIGRVS